MAMVGLPLRPGPPADVIAPPHGIFPCRRWPTLIRIAERRSEGARLRLRNRRRQPAATEPAGLGLEEHRHGRRPVLRPAHQTRRLGRADRQLRLLERPDGRQRRDGRLRLAGSVFHGLDPLFALRRRRDGGLCFRPERGLRRRGVERLGRPRVPRLQAERLDLGRQRPVSALSRIRLRAAGSRRRKHDQLRAGIPHALSRRQRGLDERRLHGGRPVGLQPVRRSDGLGRTRRPFHPFQGRVRGRRHARLRAGRPVRLRTRSVEERLPGRGVRRADHRPDRRRHGSLRCVDGRALWRRGRRRHRKRILGLSLGGGYRF